ncbi:L-type lectin-domain containing receptor kinase S.6, partial [Carica papaya]|uniref:L-type lectin-domain containing receptor kinase S.6 n=1 Tax=Carica papaya TaxID=3649 RepID=UPI000B8CA2D4
DNHIGINVNSIVSVASVDVVAKGIDLKSGRKITTWIEYNNELKLIRVWVAYLPIKPPSPLLSSQIDLSLQFKEYMHVGFSASNGQGSAMHVVERWRFKTFESHKQPFITPVDTVEEGDCLVCSPDDSHSSSNLEFGVERKPKSGDLALFLEGLAASVLTLSLIIAIISFFVIKKKRLVRRTSKEGQTYRVQMNQMPARLSLADIKSATVGFHHNKIVGSGASATVYKGCLPSGGTVAIKRFDRANWKESNRNPFSTEFATMAGCLRHKNLVQLQGWCCEGAELVLVYEYLPNGSLDKILHHRSSSEILLSWQQRLNILVGVASALSYLHEECERQIIHRDVKTCNIMLDAEFNAKLGDFGLAEVYEHRSVARESTIPAGTMGYLAPEYVYSGVPSMKTDVYSFGVVVLEVATGRRPVDDEGMILVDWVWKLWENGKLVEAADPGLRGNFEGVEMERTIMVGLCCVHPDHEKRPTVKDAARILRGEAPLPLLPARKPAIRIRSVVPGHSEEELLNSGDHSPGVDDAPWLTPRSQFS